MANNIQQGTSRRQFIKSAAVGTLGASLALTSKVNAKESSGLVSNSFDEPPFYLYLSMHPQKKVYFRCQINKAFTIGIPVVKGLWWFLCIRGGAVLFHGLINNTHLRKLGLEPSHIQGAGIKGRQLNRPSSLVPMPMIYMR